MNFIEYTEGALRTESALNPFIKDVEERGLSGRLFHSILGLSTEVNELYDAIELKDPNTWDNVNILEELGDMLWYLAIGFDEFKLTEEISKLNFEIPSDEDTVDPVTKYILIKELRHESGELLDASKKIMFYGEEANIESIQDTLLKIYMLVRDIIYLISMDPDTLESVMHINLAKLKQRFPDKFDSFRAEIRDLEAERKILEQI